MHHIISRQKTSTEKLDDRRTKIHGKVDDQGHCFPRHILPNSAAQFVKFREIPRRYYPQIPYLSYENIVKKSNKKVIAYTVIKNSAISTQIILCQALTKDESTEP